MYKRISLLKTKIYDPVCGLGQILNMLGFRSSLLFHWRCGYHFMAFETIIIRGITQRIFCKKSLILVYWKEVFCSAVELWNYIFAFY